MVHAATTSLQAAPRPGVTTLTLPTVESSLHYGWRYWAGALKTLLGGHRLQPERAGRYSASAGLTPALQRRWHQFFAAAVPGSVPTVHPFLYCQSVGTLLYTRLFADLGLNLRQLLHVRHQVQHPQGTAAYALALAQTLETSLRRTVRVGSDSALVVLETAVRNQAGQTVALVEDSFLVRQLPVADLAGADSHHRLKSEVLGLRRRGRALDAARQGSLAQSLALPADMGRGYGRLSGDKNPVHTTPLLARLFGVRRPFVQSLCLRNLVVRQLADWGLPLQHFSITFTNPATLGQTLELVHNDGRFEVVDSEGNLVAYGEA